MDRVQRARELARLEFALAVGVCLMAPLLWIAAPGEIGPMFTSWLYDRLVQLIPLLGIAGTIVGLVLMIRIYRADPEPDQRAWRYRERD
jgi:hypothetical protein